MPKASLPLPKRLKAARLRSKLSQKALGIAAKMDEFVASARMNQYEKGIHNPDYSTAQRLAKVLRIPTAYLYADDEEDAELLLNFRELSPAARRRFLALLRNQ